MILKELKEAVEKKQQEHSIALISDAMLLEIIKRYEVVCEALRLKCMCFEDAHNKLCHACTVLSLYGEKVPL